MSDRKTVYIDEQAGGRVADTSRKEELDVVESDMPGIEYVSNRKVGMSDSDSDVEREEPVERKEPAVREEPVDHEEPVEPVKVNKMSTNDEDGRDVQTILDERIQERRVLNDDDDDERDDDDKESMTTNELLAVDPLYFRLNLFLQSDEGESVANMMKRMIVQLGKLNETIENKNSVVENKLIEQLSVLNKNIERLVEKNA